MRTAKAHPRMGWLRLQPRDYSRSMDRLLVERDNLDDPNYSGPAPGYLRWVAEEELPQLARNPYYRQQIKDHLDQLARLGDALKASIDAVAGSMLQELDGLEAEVLQLTSLVGGDDS